MENIKDSDYLVHNINKIAKHLEHINWNLGKFLAVLTKNEKLKADIEDAEISEIGRAHV